MSSILRSVFADLRSRTVGFDAEKPQIWSTQVERTGECTSMSGTIQASLLKQQFRITTRTKATHVGETGRTSHMTSRIMACARGIQELPAAMGVY